MMDINHVVLLGRLVRDAELKTTGGGQTLANFSIAVNRRKKKDGEWDEEANFFEVTVWGKQAEVIHKHLVKGKMVGIDGELKQEKWEKEGKKMSRVIINANYVQLLDWGGKREEKENVEGEEKEELQEA